MYGSATAAPRAVSLTAGPPAGGATGNSGGMTSDHQGILAALFTLMVAYVVWAFVEQQEGIQRSVEPHNVGINVRNILLVTFTAILGINIVKVLTVKMAGWGVPGASSIATFVGNA